MVKKLPIRDWMKPVITSLREGNKTWNELMKTKIPSEGREVQISIHTLDRILKEYLGYWGLARKEGDVWVWYDHRRVFSVPEYNLAIEHSRKLFLSIFGKPGTFKTDPYDMLDWIVFSDEIESHLGLEPRFGLLVNRDIVCLREHISSGYHDIDIKMKDYRERVEKAGGVFSSEEIVCTPEQETIHESTAKKRTQLKTPTEWPKMSINWFHPMPDGPKDHEELKSWLVGEICRLNHLAQNGTPLKGTCSYCPSRNVTIEESESHTTFKA